MHSSPLSSSLKDYTVYGLPRASFAAFHHAFGCFLVVGSWLNAFLSFVLL
jgi:hypothetical protein